jgi:arsenite-transporting ATPase
MAAAADEAGAGAADVVIVDTAPTGHALRLLAMPDAVAAWLRTFLTVLQRDRLAGRLPALASELIQLSRQVRRLLQLVRDRQRTAFVVVARPAAVAAAETRRLVSGLRELDVPVAALVVNGLTPPAGCARCRRLAARQARAVQELRQRWGRAPVLAAPLTAPPPRGAAALREWAAQWRILGA